MKETLEEWRKRHYYAHTNVEEIEEIAYEALCDLEKAKALLMRVHERLDCCICHGDEGSMDERDHFALLEQLRKFLKIEETT